MRSFSRCLGLFVFLGTVGFATPLEYRLVATDITGAQTQIDFQHTTTWSFNLGAGVSWALKGGTLVMKDGPQTSATSLLTLWEGAAGSSVAAQLILTNNQFDAQVTHPQSFDVHNYFFTTAYTLNGGATGQLYTLTLTSAAPDAQNDAYFIKGDNWAFQDQNGDPLPNPPVITPDGFASAAPEPGAYILMSSGLILLVVSRRAMRRGRRALPA